MAKKKRQRISYVLPLASTPGGHRLGVNGLAFDDDRSILYTGGRDGVICAWDLDLEAQRVNQQEAGAAKHKKSTVSFRKQVQAHTHWVNDIVLVKNNLGLVSASSDVTVKLWRPHAHESSQAYTIGSHSDYIKCLATPDRTANWVASGGLDHRICLWDLNGGGKNLEINLGKVEDVVKGSVYCLRARGSLLASGGPESVVRLWDIKSGKGITKLVGHTDNVRDILISDDGDTLLTASSDQTIKVWSIAAGRCIHTLTMHNDSVWCMYSDDPNLAVFYSGDKSGLVAKTDTRRAMEIDDGVSVAVCQEHDGIARVLPVGDSVWTATSSSSVNRWLDVDTELEVETPPASPREERTASPEARSHLSPEPRASSPLPTTNGTTNDTTNGEVDQKKRIPHNAILRVSNTALHPGRKHLGRHPNVSATNLRKASEAMITDDLSLVVPIRGQPAETIEGQNGLIKHVMLNDRKRILTLDTAGEVVLWDLLKCIPIKSFGRRHLDEVVPDVNTTESVANWCGVDTKTGKITVMLEENYCFDAEVYADELDLPSDLAFREDQRINLGKWVLRNLFSKLIDEEVARDEAYRRTLQSSVSAPPPTGLVRPGAPTSIKLPESVGATPLVSPGTVVTPRASNGHSMVPATPGLAIGAATPGFAPLTATLPPTAEEEPTRTPNGAPSRSSLGQTPRVQTPHVQPTPSATESQNVDYFSSTTATGNSQSEASSESEKVPKTPGGGPATTESNAHGLVSTPTSPTEEKKKGLFGKKFGMGMSFPKKMTSRSSAEVKAPVASTEERSSDTASVRSSEKDVEKVNIEDNFFGVVQKIRLEYDEHLESKTDQPLPPGITPPPPTETPVLHPPPHTTIIIQEDNPESGGLADQYRGEISELGNPAEVDTLEKIAPMWLGDLLLRNQIPYKDTVKVSFVLHPYENLLPPIASPDGNARLNANRMLRAKKIMAYIAERIEAPPVQQQAPPSETAAEGEQSTETEHLDVPPHAAVEPEESPESQLKPEEYLELYCQNQLVHPNTTLATLRVHVWRTGGDVVLYYKSNGRKQLRLPHPSQVPTDVESEETTGVVR
ncbi:hypothetical protein Z517_04906 [Fonsecaea pedrosoi CBS 271.37]|uniref:WD repeat-containing protein 48 n=1 Tax=Fonsecaea pedrosoi CBS 271.37 TaxID=1442368 RepID=A0A0D2GTJ9_9EURO|nr:uncharacterized protein Z517_04906 [Fonsecaea pedrosoi CBS 271.37]KIW81880.1 hypothetical protein Z517_04906 [Fonsecaea pedrosoi CBS 271.37]